MKRQAEHSQRNNQHKKPLPKLFMPPPTNKPKQNE